MTDLLTIEPAGVVKGRLRPGERVAAIFVLCVMFALIPGGFFLCVWLMRAHGDGFAIAAFVGILLSELALVAAGRRLMRHGWREVEREKFRLCLSCRYPLERRQEIGDWHCPECASSWDGGVLEPSWRWTYQR